MRILHDIPVSAVVLDIAAVVLPVGIFLCILVAGFAVAFCTTVYILRALGKAPYLYMLDFKDRATDAWFGVGTTVDYHGRPVAHCITYEHFLNGYVSHRLHRCHHYTNWGFLYDDCSELGHSNAVVGFLTEYDRAKYNEYRKEFALKDYMEYQPTEVKVD